MTGPTYEIKQGEHPYITCFRCGSRSYNANDIAQKYCGLCHQFHQVTPLDHVCDRCANPTATVHAFMGRQLCDDCLIEVGA